MLYWKSRILYFLQLTSDLNGVSISLVEEGFDHCEEDVVTIVRRAAQLFTSAGARVESVNLPFHKDGQYIHVGLSWYD